MNTTFTSKESECDRFLEESQCPLVYNKPKEVEVGTNDLTQTRVGA